MTETYRIVRYKFGETKEIQQTGLTLKEAKKHCQRADTSGDGWFDGYEQED